MAKINYIEINKTKRFIENVAYLEALPVANADSEDFVSVNNVLYVKQINNGVYSYAEIGGGGGITVIEKGISTTDFENFTFVNEMTLEECKTLNNEDNVILKLKLEMQGQEQYMYAVKNASVYVASTNAKQTFYLAPNQGSGNSLRIGCYYSIDESNYGAYIEYVKPIRSVVFSAPTSATSGTITGSELATLQENDQNYIIFNDEIYRLNDKQHESGYLVYTHNGHDTTGGFFQKCITITISTRGWVLESQENQPKLESGVSIKTINNQSILGSGNIAIEGGGSGGGSSNVVERSYSYTSETPPQTNEGIGLTNAEFNILYNGGSLVYNITLDNVSSSFVFKNVASYVEKENGEAVNMYYKVVIMQTSSLGFLLAPKVTTLVFVMNRNGDILEKNVSNYDYITKTYYIDVGFDVYNYPFIGATGTLDVNNLEGISFRSSGLLHIVISEISSDIAQPHAGMIFNLGYNEEAPSNSEMKYYAIGNNGTIYVLTLNSVTGAWSVSQQN